MERLAKVFSRINSEIQRIGVEVDIEELCVLVGDEYVPVMLFYDSLKEDILKELSSKYKIRNYAVVYQESMKDLMGLDSYHVKLLLHFISMISYENKAFGLTLNSISKDLGMSINTIRKGIDVLIERNLIAVEENNRGRVFVVNPAIAWKGNKYAKDKVLKKFDDGKSRIS